MNYSQTFLMTNMNAFPAHQVPILQRELEQLDDKTVGALMMTDIKNPTTALILAILFGEVGVDRFYIGQKGLGFAKLALAIVSFLTLFIFIGFFGFIALYIWKIVDCCLIMGACREENFNRVMIQLNQIKAFSPAKNTTSPAEPASQVIAEPVAEVVETPVVAEAVVAEQTAEEVVVEETPITEEVVVEAHTQENAVTEEPSEAPEVTVEPAVEETPAEVETPVVEEASDETVVVAEVTEEPVLAETEEVVSEEIVTAVVEEVVETPETTESTEEV